MSTRNRNDYESNNSEYYDNEYESCQNDDRYEPDYRDYDDYSYEESIYDACDGMEDAYWNID